MPALAAVRLARHPVAAAIGMLVAASAALAAPTPNQMPGAGVVVAISPGSAGTSLGGIGTPLTGLVSGGGFGIDGKVVIRWGGAGAPVDATNPQGFNLGANATLYLGAISPGSALLNIDASGNPSQIYGNLVSLTGPVPAAGSLTGCALCSNAPALFVSNANGIVVGPGARIVVPPTHGGVGLIGANLDNATSINEFVGNNDWVAPALPVYGNSFISFGSVPATGNISIAGSINGDLNSNESTRYVLLAGNNVQILNTGNLFAARVAVFAGVVANASTQSVGGVTGQSVNRLFDVDHATIEACCGVGKATNRLQIVADVSGNIVNEGSISAIGGGAGVVLLQSKGNIRSGIEGSSDTLVGIFADTRLMIDAYANDATVSIYNVVSGYTTNTSLREVEINRYATNADGFLTVQKFAPSVIVDALTPGTQPSSITTYGPVEIHGGSVNIASSINDVPNTIGGVQGDWDLIVRASKDLTIAGDLGAGHDVLLFAAGPLTISGSVRADADGVLNGGILVANQGAGAPTTLTGSLYVPPTSASKILVETMGPTAIDGTIVNRGGDVGIWHDGPAGPLSIDGSVFAVGSVSVRSDYAPASAPFHLGGEVTAGGNASFELGSPAGDTTAIFDGDVRAAGNVEIALAGGLGAALHLNGSIVADYDVTVRSPGSAVIGGIEAGSDVDVEVNGLEFTVTRPVTASNAIRLYSDFADIEAYPDGTLTAAQIYAEAMGFRGVNSSGQTYTSEAEKPLAQIVTNRLDLVLRGSINAPIAGNTNWTLNSLDVAPLETLAPVITSVSAIGSGFQAVNLRILGDALFDTGATTSPFIGVPLTTGGFPAGGLQGNLGSQLILQADGALTILGTPTGSLTGPAWAVQWPGGAVFTAGTTLQLLAPLYNAWSVASPPFGGVFFSAPVIALGGYVATSGTAWANFSTKPVTGDPTVYQIRQLGTNAFGFAATDAFVKNDYYQTVVGGPVCAVAGPTTWTACP